MPSTIAEVYKLFAEGTESVTLTRADWEALQAISKGYSANHLEVTLAKREVERVKRISKPVWRACKVVATQMRQEMSYAYRSGEVPAGRIFDCEMRLRHSMDVSWSDLLENHPKRMMDWRRQNESRRRLCHHASADTMLINSTAPVFLFKGRHADSLVQTPVPFETFDWMPR